MRGMRSVSDATSTVASTQKLAWPWLAVRRARVIICSGSAAVHGNVDWIAYVAGSRPRSSASQRSCVASFILSRANRHVQLSCAAKCPVSLRSPRCRSGRGASSAAGYPLIFT